MSEQAVYLEMKLTDALARIAKLEATTKELSYALKPTNGPSRTAATNRTAINPLTWNIIAAAVAAVCQEPHRIVGMQIQGPPISLWAFEGRRAVFYSHHPKR